MKKTVKQTKSHRHGKRSAQQPYLSDSSKPIIVPKVKESICIYTDGSTLNNGQENNKGSYAFIVVENGNIIYEYSRCIENTTNNRCELTAITDAIRWIQENLGTESISIYSDSEYCVKGLNIWSKAWRNKSFIGIKNPDMWREICALADNNTHIKYRWVKGHADNPYNNRCDELCNLAYYTGGGKSRPKAEPKKEKPTAKQYLLEKYLPNTGDYERDIWYRCSDWAKVAVEAMEEYAKL